MTSTPSRAAALTGVLVASALALSACGSAASVNAGSGGSSDSAKAATATSAQDFGGMDALVAAAKKEGQLNLITLPRDWAGYGKLMDAFTAKYGIKINDENPEGSSQDEITPPAAAAPASPLFLSPRSGRPERLSSLDVLPVADLLISLSRLMC